jgi:hypothetical protein
MHEASLNNLGVSSEAHGVPGRGKTDLGFSQAAQHLESSEMAGQLAVLGL